MIMDTSLYETVVDENERLHQRVGYLEQMVLHLSRQLEQQESEHKFRSLVQQSADGIIMVDEQGTFIEWNPCMEDLTGLRCDEVLGKPAADILFALLPKEYRTPAILEQYRASVQQVVTTGAGDWTNRLMEQYVQNADGKRWYAQQHAFTIPTQHGFLLCAIIRDITARIQQEEKLRFQANLLDMVGQSVIATALDGTITYWNYAAEKMYGRKAAQVYGRNIVDVMVTDISQEQTASIMERLNAGESWEGEVRIQHRDGSFLTTLVVDSPYYDEHGTLSGLVGISSDISERKRLEQALRQSEHHYRMLAHNIPDAVVFLFDHNLRYLVAAGRLLSVLGMTPETLEGKTLMDALPEDVAAIGEPLYRAILAGTAPHEVEQHYGDRVYRTQPVSLRNEQGEITTGMIISQDITDRKRMESELREAERFTRSILDSLPAHIAVLDSKGTILAVNKAWESFASDANANPQRTGEGINYLAICEHAAGHGAEEAALFAERICAVIAGECDQAAMEYPCYLPDGTTRWFTGQVTRMQGMENAYVVISHTDITSIKHAEQAIEHARDAAEIATRAKSDFLANMSHELRTPLNAILGFAQVMVRSSTLAPEHREYLDIIMRSGEHLLTLINNVLDLSKIEAGYMALNPSNFDLYRLLTNLYDMFKVQTQKKGLFLFFHYLPDVPQYICTDEVKLRQVLINLLSNAVKFTEHGSIALHVRTTAPPDAEGTEEDAPAHCTLQFEIVDTGTGIAEDDLEHIFEAFMQTSSGKQAREGTGLGLTISRRFVQLLGGDMTIRHNEHGGSVFAFDVVVTMVKASNVRGKAEVRQVVGLAPGQQHYRVLVVDDQAESRHVLVRLLEPVGFELREASNGAEALAVWEMWHPHLVWMDMRMPVMDGYETTRRIKTTEQGSGTVVIALTTSAFEEDRAEALAAGCDGFLTKPIHTSDIFEVMSDYLGVSYRYKSDEQPASPLAAQPEAETELTAETLAALPAEWVASLHYAAILGDVALLNETVEQIHDTHATLAALLQRLVDTFQFALITDVAAAAMPPKKG
jgi:PAS domain S-box-containing protein